MGKNPKVVDVLLWGHLVLALPFWWTQLSHMWNDSIQGLSISNYAITMLTVTINFYLVQKSHKNQASRLTFQIVLIYLLGIITYASFVIVMVIKDIGVWDNKDTLTIYVVVGLITATAMYLWSKKGKLYNTIADPLTKGIYSAMIRSVPQLVWAWKIYTDGGSGLDPIMIITFHCMVMIRITQTVLIIQEAGWDRNRKGLLITELANESAMILVTVIWLIF